MSTSGRSHLVKFALLALVVTWAGFAYAALANYMAARTLFARILDGKPYVSDFANVYNAAILARRCLTEKIDIYDPAVQEASLLPLIDPVKPELPFYLQYPPFFFVFVLPLAYLSMNAAWFVWVLGGIAMSCWAVWVCADGFSRPDKVRAVLLVFSSFPAWLSCELGQTSFLVLPALAGSFLFMERQSFRAGLFSCLAMIKLQYYPILGLTGLVIGRWRYFFGALAGGGIYALLSILVLGVDNCLRFPQALLGGETGSQVSGVSESSMQNIRGELALLFGDGSPVVKQLSALLFLLALFFSAWLWLKVYPRLKAACGDGAQKLIASATVLLILVFSLHAHTQDYLAAALPCLWLFRAFRDAGKSSVTTFAILAFPGISWIFFFLMPVFQFVRIQPFLLWALCLLLLVLQEILTRYRDKGEVHAKSS